MCWSFLASGVFAIIGIISVVWFIHKKESKLLWIPLAYFALMEVLQAVTYFYLGSCSSQGNKILTLLSYLHIAFQPIFINLLVMYFIPSSFRKKIFWPVIAIASVFTVLMIFKLFPFASAGMCNLGSTLCGAQMCSFKGDWHLAWSIPFNDIGLEAMTYYYLAVFLLPLIYGSWRTTLYGLLTGPLLAIFISSNPNEWPAIWCLLSIAIILAVLDTRLREMGRVKRWYFWKYPK